jgi:hypothetical protein
MDLVKMKGWRLCQGREGIWVWHSACIEVPDDERGVSQHSWLPMDKYYVCILCEEKMPDEIQTLTILYTHGRGG